MEKQTDSTTVSAEKSVILLFSMVVAEKENIDDPDVELPGGNP